MKKDDNSGVSIKQIIITALFLTITTFGGLNAYRIVCNNKANTIQNIESATTQNTEYETALVDNTEEDIVYSKNIQYLAVSVINEPEDKNNLEVFDTELAKQETNTNFSEKVISRGNYVREQIAEEISTGATSGDEKPNKLIDTVVNEIKELAEKQEELVETMNSEFKNDIENNNSGDKAIDQISDEEINDQNLTNNNSYENTESIQLTGVPSEYIRTIDVKATAYCLCKKCCGKSPSNPAYGITASGLKIIPGTGMKVVASDPSVIPLGTEVYIEGLYGAKDYGYAIVADTGSAIKNLKIDLYMDTHQMALNWGVKTVRVYILDK